MAHIFSHRGKTLQNNKHICTSNLHDGLNTLRHGWKQIDLRMFWLMKLCRMEPCQVFTLQTVFRLMYFSFACTLYTFGLTFGSAHWPSLELQHCRRGKEQLQWDDNRRQHTLLFWSIIFRFIYLLSKIKKEPNDVTLPCEWQEGEW